MRASQELRLEEVVGELVGRQTGLRERPIFSSLLVTTDSTSREYFQPLFPSRQSIASTTKNTIKKRQHELILSENTSLRQKKQVKSGMRTGKASNSWTTHLSSPCLMTNLLAREGDTEHAKKQTRNYQTRRIRRQEGGGSRLSTGVASIRDAKKSHGEWAGTHALRE